jgi:hypothetical protein
LKGGPPNQTLGSGSDESVLKFCVILNFLSEENSVGQDAIKHQSRTRCRESARN